MNRDERDAFYDGAHVPGIERIEPVITREPVVPASSSIATAGWADWCGVGDKRHHQCAVPAERECGILEVGFVNGSVYRYYHVPQPVWEVMTGRYGATPVQSVGSYFSAAVRRHPDAIPYRVMQGPDAVIEVDTAP